MNIRVLTFSIGFVLLALATANACSVPVFRYALESWAPADYEMLVFHRGPLSDDERKLIAACKASAEDKKIPVNLSITPVDVSEKMDEHVQKIWDENKTQTLPRAVLVFPESTDAIWSGPLSAELPRSLADSPARTEVTKRLANGESAVFVLLDGNDAKLNVAAAQLLEKELAGLQATMKLPEQDDADEHLPRRRKLDLPLLLKFSILRISRTDTKEKALIDLLMKTDKKLLPAQPVVFPIFGRGRVLCALSGPSINASGLADCATFLAGACSCQVKELNPGVDMLMSVNWDELLNAAVEQAAKAPPEAQPVSSVEKKSAQIAKISVPLPPSQPTIIRGNSSSEESAVDAHFDSRKMLWFAIAGAVVLVIFTGWRALKSSKAAT